MPATIKPQLLFLLLTVFFINVKAQTVKDLPIEIKTFLVDVKADNLTATTVETIEFFNPNNKVLDGEYNFSLQDNQLVTGFCLDINGYMREGVIVEKQKARVAYENIIRRRIDPGLLEMTTGNNYRVRIYPMPAQGVRKIKITITELLKTKENTLQYFLPFDVSYTIKNFSANISVKTIFEPPFIKEGLLKNKNFEGKDIFALSTVASDIILKRPLSFEIPLQQNNVAAFISTADCNNAFAIKVKAAETKSVLPVLNNAVIFWDVSASAAKRNISKELQFLEEFIAERKIKNAEVVIFNSAADKPRKFNVSNSFNAVKHFLLQQNFDGGTQLGTLNLNNYNADVFILVSDGIGNFGKQSVELNDKPVFCINSSATANHTLLKQIAAKANGAYINLYATTVNTGIAETKNPATVIAAVTQGGKKINTVYLPKADAGWFTVTGNLYNTTEDIVIDFTEQGRPVSQQKIILKDALIISDTSLLAAQFLQHSNYLQQSETAAEELLFFAKQSRYVTPVTSFIVLDNLNDYIDNGIEPPADLQEAYKKNYDIVKKRSEQEAAQKLNEGLNNLKKAANLYNDRIAWWGKNEDLISIANIEMQSEKMAFEQRAATASNNTTAKELVNNFNSKFSKSELNEVVVTGYGTQRRRDVTGAVATISGAQLSRGAVNIAQALQGRVAGVQVIQNNGVAGGVDRIYIRGNGSITGLEPLYVLDGAPVDAAIVNSININDIESISVFKDNQAGALYGSRAAGGAVVITSKRGRNISYSNGSVKYKNLEDVAYVTELKEAGQKNLYAKFLEMKSSHTNEPAFYFDAAQLLFESGDTAKALTVLSNLAEMNNESHQLLRALGYVLEEWKMYALAIEVYGKVLLIKEEEPQSYRDLALAYEKNKQHQQAVDLLYKVLSKNFYQYEDRYRGLKSLLLNEMNLIIAQHRNSLDLSKINEAVIKPLPVDIRIVVDWNKDETDIDLHVIEPDGEECFYGHKQSKNGGRMSEDFTQGYGPEEYQIKTAKKGKYIIRVKYYGDRYQKQQIPSFIKLTVYKNFGKPNQTITIENFIMDYQQGQIEISNVKI